MFEFYRYNGTPSNGWKYGWHIADTFTMSTVLQIFSIWTNMTVFEEDGHICQHIASINVRWNVVEILLDTDRDVAICNMDSYRCLHVINIKGRKHMYETMDDV